MKSGCGLKDVLSEIARTDIGAHALAQSSQCNNYRGHEHVDCCVNVILDELGRDYVCNKKGLQLDGSS